MNKLFFFTLIFFTITLFADAGNKKVKLIGETNESTPKYITPKYLEQNHRIFKMNVYNPWEKKADDYEGVFLDALAKKYGTNKTKLLKLIALDDYNIEFTKELYESERILLAFKVNGKYISVEDKGPMRVVFVDYDSSQKKYENNLYKWLWMIKKIEFK